jgi:hypothetical protein
MYREALLPGELRFTCDAVARNCVAATSARPGRQRTCRRGIGHPRHSKLATSAAATTAVAPRPSCAAYGAALAPPHCRPRASLLDALQPLWRPWAGGWGRRADNTCHYASPVPCMACLRVCAHRTGDKHAPEPNFSPTPSHSWGSALTYSSSPSPLTNSGCLPMMSSNLRCGAS